MIMNGGHCSPPISRGTKDVWTGHVVATQVRWLSAGVQVLRWVPDIQAYIGRAAYRADPAGRSGGPLRRAGMRRRYRTEDRRIMPVIEGSPLRVAVSFSATMRQPLTSP
jgi:hypothetical protein